MCPALTKANDPVRRSSRPISPVTKPSMAPFSVCLKIASFAARACSTREPPCRRVFRRLPTHRVAVRALLTP
jgi:hypothetical protein